MTSTINAFSAGSGGITQAADASGILQLQTNSTAAVTINASQNVGIGTSSPVYKLDVSGTAVQFNNTAGAFDLRLYNTARYDGRITVNSTGLEISQRQALPMLFLTSDTERMRIDSSGNLLVGTTTATVNNEGFRIVSGASNSDRAELGSAATTNSGVGWSMYSTGAAAYRFYVGWGGTIFATSATITAISDQRLKENIRDLDDGLTSVMALKPRKFDWKEGKGADVKNARGFIAQEFEQIFPDMIDTWQDPAPEGEEPYKAVRADLIPTLVKAIQEQQALITQLQADVAALKGA